MTLLDIIEFYNMKNDKPVDDIGSLYEDIELDERVDKDVLIGELLEECGAMRCIYETTATFKYFSDLFFKKYKWNISKLCDTLELKYDPLVNKVTDWTEVTDIDQNLDTDEDVNENRTKDNTGNQVVSDRGTQTNVDTGTQTVNDSGTQTINNTGTQKNEYSDNEENTVSAMNSSNYEPDRSTETTGENERTDNLQSQRTDALQSQRSDNLTKTRTDNLDQTRTDNLTETIEGVKTRDKNETLAWDETDTHTEKGISNITFQELIEKERKVAEFSIYKWISRKYAKELFLLVY